MGKKKSKVMGAAAQAGGYDFMWLIKHPQLVVDTRNATAAVKTGRSKIVKA